MAEKPILFNGEMVRVILAGRKTVTRRVINPQPQRALFGWLYFKSKRSVIPTQSWMNETVMLKYLPSYCLYGLPGDRLWVRETWQLWRNDPDWGLEDWPHKIPKAQPARWNLAYRANCAQNDEGLWRPSIHMPRWASRIMLDVTGVRVERVQDISAEDAMWEGIALAHNPINKLTIEALGNSSSTGLAVIEDFIALWDSIYAKRGFGWHANPWVWVVEFEQVE